MPNEHAKLSASSSHRWLTCTPSAKLEENFENKSTTYADEGTFAHELGELLLSKKLGKIGPRKLTNELKKREENQYYSKAMLEYVEVYADAVGEKIAEAYQRCKDPIIKLEERLDFSAYVPEGFGTGDTVIIADGTLEIVDLKYGQGVKVNAQGNSQLMLYALGAIDSYGMLYDIENVRLTIVQPRLDHISTQELTVEELLSWGESIKELAQKAYKGEGEFVAGEHCRFCRAKNVCRARSEKNLQLAKYDFQDPVLLSDEEVGEILKQADELQNWAKDVKDYAFEKALNGTKISGWKLVEGKSSRKYTDAETVKATLNKAGYSDQQVCDFSLKGITALEKLLGKDIFNTLLKDLIVKPEGKPTLVEESDPRPELHTTASAIADFE